jgi:hypothetical protein
MTPVCVLQNVSRNIWIITRCKEHLILPSHLISRHLIFIYLDMSSINYKDMNSRKEEACLGDLRNFELNSDLYIDWCFWQLIEKVTAMYSYHWRICWITIFLLYLWISANHSFWGCYSPGWTACWRWYICPDSPAVPLFDCPQKLNSRVPIEQRTVTLLITLRKLGIPPWPCDTLFGIVIGLHFKSYKICRHNGWGSWQGIVEIFKHFRRFMNIPFSVTVGLFRKGLQ